MSLNIFFYNISKFVFDVGVWVRNSETTLCVYLDWVSKWIYGEKWRPGFSLSEKGAINKERKKVTINPVILD